MQISSERRQNDGTHHFPCGVLLQAVQIRRWIHVSRDRDIRTAIRVNLKVTLGVNAFRSVRFQSKEPNHVSACAKGNPAWIGDNLSPTITKLSARVVTVFSFKRREPRERAFPRQASRLCRSSVCASTASARRARYRRRGCRRQALGKLKGATQKDFRFHIAEFLSRSAVHCAGSELVVLVFEQTLNVVSEL
jgi:hypothetical protein